jgi:hypothetical protein
MAMASASLPGARMTVAKVLAAAHSQGRQITEETFIQALKTCESLGAYDQALGLLENRLRARRQIPSLAWAAMARLRLRAAKIAAISEPGLLAQHLPLVDESMAKLEKYAEFDGSDFIWLAFATYCRRWFTLYRGNPRKQMQILRKLVAATANGRNAIFAALRDEDEKSGGVAQEVELLRRFGIESAQKVLSAIIISRSLDKRPQKERDDQYVVLLDICQKQLDERQHATEFWDDVDNADLRLLRLATPPRPGDEKAKRSSYDQEASEIAEQYRRAMGISATCGEIDSIKSYVWFWYELAKFLQTQAIVEDHPHWEFVRLALERADFDGITPPADSPARRKRHAP